MKVAIDIFLLAIIILFPMIYYKKGLVGSILGFGRFVLSLIGAVIFGKILKAAGSDSVFGGAIASFLLIYVILTVVIFCMKHIDIPFLTKFDKLLGLVMGMGLGLFIVCLLSTVLYSVLDLLSVAKNDPQIMEIYNNSWVFKLIYDLGMLEYIRNLI